MSESEYELATRWFLNGEVGLSSRAILAAALELPAKDVSYPFDPSDLLRCVKMLLACPFAIRGLDRLALTRPATWGRLVPHWYELVNSLHDERGPGERWSAPKTYARMTALLAPQKVLTGAAAEQPTPAPREESGA